MTLHHPESSHFYEISFDLAGGFSFAIPHTGWSQRAGDRITELDGLPEAIRLRVERLMHFHPDFSAGAKSPGEQVRGGVNRVEELSNLVGRLAPEAAALTER